MTRATRPARRSKDRPETAPAGTGRSRDGRRAAAQARRTAAGESPVGVTVREMLAQLARALRLRLIAGRSGIENLILMTRVQRPGLALNGYSEYIRYGRVQIVGNSEIGFLAKLSSRRRLEVLGELTRCRISCFVVTRALTPPPELVRQTNLHAIPLLVTPLDSTTLIKKLTVFLDDRLAPRVEMHAVLMDVFGLGVLIVGESGIGKSECALDLIDRGHRLVADDVTVVKRVADVLVGSSPDMTRYHMELRGLGVINIKDLYGVSSIRTSKRVELVVNLERWKTGKDYDRLGLRQEGQQILGVNLPLIRMPVAPGRNIALLVEVASRNQLLKERGYDAARRLAARVDELAASAAEETPEVRRH
jgi:HPr kinase/phosphorylase